MVWASHLRFDNDNYTKKMDDVTKSNDMSLDRRQRRHMKSDPKRSHPRPIFSKIRE